MAYTTTELSLLKLKTAIAILIAPYIGTYEGTEAQFSSVNQIFDADTYVDYLWLFDTLPLIFDGANLTTLPAIWVRGNDPPVAKVVGGIEVIIDAVPLGLPDVTKRSQYYTCNLINYDPNTTMAKVVDVLMDSWHPLVTVWQPPTYIPRTGISNERAVIKLMRALRR